MRRDEFSIEDKSSIKDILDDCEYGTLSLISDNKPYCVALNFVLYKDSIYFHGAKEGKKIEAIKQNNIASFLVVKPYSFIPSYFSNTKAACPATQFFASVLFEGELSFIKNVDYKAEVLNALMKKFQNEDSFEKIDYQKSMYTKMIDKTEVIELKIKKQSCKMKFGQNLNKDRKDILIGHLKNLNSKIAKETLAILEKF